MTLLNSLNRNRLIYDASQRSQNEMDKDKALVNDAELGTAIRTV